MASRVLPRLASRIAQRGSSRAVPVAAFSTYTRTVTTAAAAPASRANLAPALLLATGLGATVAYATAADQYTSSKEEIAACAAAIHDLLDDADDLGPTIVRLAWHASGTYDKVSATGGSDGAKMRFKPESAHGANAGLEVARSALEPVKKLFPNIS